MAWDKHLLSGPQHFTLLISGLRGVHPIVNPDGTYTRTAVARGAVPHFRVGLTPGYKPTKEDAAELLRKFGLKDDYDASAEVDANTGQQQEPEDGIEEEQPTDLDFEMGDEQTSTEETASQGFRPFSLSSSLESLLNGHFLPLLQLRIKYGLGWAGAELLRSEIETTQREATDIMLNKPEVRLLVVVIMQSTLR